MARGEGGREREGARAWRRLIGQEIKLGLGEMGKWEAEEGEAEKEGERESGSENAHKYAISHAGVDKKDPFIASPTLPLSSPHTLPLLYCPRRLSCSTRWRRLVSLTSHPVVIEVPPSPSCSCSPGT